MIGIMFKNEIPMQRIFEVINYNSEAKSAFLYYYGDLCELIGYKEFVENDYLIKELKKRRIIIYNLILEQY